MIMTSLYLKTLFFLSIIISGIYSGKAQTKDFIDVVKFQDNHLVLDSENGIHWISESGNIIKSKKQESEKPRCILASNQQIIIGGINGSIIFSDHDDEFVQLKSGSKKNINSLASFKEKIIAGCDNGELLIGNQKDGFEKTQLELKGNIVSLSAGMSMCYGVTNLGEIISTKDAIKWTIIDFNEKYKGFYKKSYFKSIVVTDNQIAITGKKEDGSPILLFSTRGSVWTERSLNYDDENGIPSYLNDIINDLYYDATGDQFVLVCNNGNIMIVPPCSHCNRLYNFTSDNLNCISGTGQNIVIAGQNGFIKTINIQAF